MAEARQIPYYGHPALGLDRRDSTGTFRYIRDTFFQAGLDSHTLPPSQPEDSFSTLTNVMPPLTGVLQRRWGTISWNNTILTAAPTRMFSFQNDTSGTRRIFTTSTSQVWNFQEDGTSVGAIFTPSASSAAPRLAVSRSFAYFVDGIAADLKKYDGTTLTNWGITAPATAVSVGAPSAGSITLTSGRKYYCVFRNSGTGHLSGLNPVSASSGPVTAQNIPLSNIPTSADGQVDSRVLLATADGGDETTLYLLHIIADNVTTTYTDSTTETDLLQANIYQETDSQGVEHGVADNTPPPNGTLVVKHRGRLFSATSSEASGAVASQILSFSKSLDDLTTSTGTICGRYEESWPGTYQMDISEGAETVRGLMSDGTTLWIGTERHIRRLDGDGPTNFTTPEIAFNETGLLNQEVWKMVFLEGQPVGFIWLTPDFRVMQSDFNTYRDIGTAIQDQLNAINVSTAQTSHAAFVSDGEFNFYLLFVPGAGQSTPNLCFCYDLHLHRWFKWTFPNSATCSLYNINSSGVPQWLMGTAAQLAAKNVLTQILSSATTDYAPGGNQNITSTATTAWLHLGDPTLRKLLNEVEVVSDDVASLTVSVSGATAATDFTSPVAIVSSAAPTVVPMGTYKVFTAAHKSSYRYYQLSFVSASTTSNVLRGFSTEAVPLHRL